MKTKNTSKTKPYYVPASIQKLFTITVVGLFALQTSFIAVTTLTQFQQGSDYRPQLQYFLIYNMIPVLIFLLAYALNPRTLGVLSRSFEALLISLSALISWMFLSMLLPMVFFTRTGLGYTQTYEYLFAVIFMGLYAAILLALRKKKIWS